MKARDFLVIVSLAF